MKERFDLSNYHEEEQLPVHTHCECVQYRCTGLLSGSVKIRQFDLQVEKGGEIGDCTLPPTRRWTASTTVGRGMFGGKE